MQTAFLSADKTTESSILPKAVTLNEAECTSANLSQRCSDTVLAFCEARARQQALYEVKH